MESGFAAWKNFLIPDISIARARADIFFIEFTRYLRDDL